MNNYNYIPDLVIENGRMINKNFSGAQTKYTREGERWFNAVIQPEFVDQLKEQGWNIKMLPPKEGVEGSQPLFFMKVRVTMDGPRPPKVYLVTSKKKTQLDKESVGTIDHADIKNVDMVIHPYKYDDGTKTYVSAYLKELYVTIEEDSFAAKYENLETEDLDEAISVF